jgi:hypothetical protein
VSNNGPKELLPDQMSEQGLHFEMEKKSQAVVPDGVLIELARNRVIKDSSNAGD